MRRWLTRSAVPAALAATALVLSALPAAPADDAAATPLVTVLTGEQEAPSPGDDDGHGAFAAVVKGDTLCYVLVAVRIETPTAAHIHAAPPGVPGGIVVGLETPDRVSKGCITAMPDAADSTTTLTESELAAIVADPSGFYVNVHNASFPTGAIRGQLG